MTAKKQIPLTDKPCERCLGLAVFGHIRAETVQRMPEKPFAPLSREDNKPCCRDCAAADTIVRCGYAPGFIAARIAVGNDRQEQYRLPGVLMGLVKVGLVAPSEPGDFENQLKWLHANNWFGAGWEEDT